MKNLKYLAALSIPVTAIIGVYFQSYWMFFTPVYAFVLIPILELLLPLDPSNNSPEETENKRLNPLFDWLLYLNIPIVYGLLIYGLLHIDLRVYSTYELFGLISSIGIVMGTNGINVAHELGHRQKKWERFLSKFLLLPSLYMHFYIEHNFGHHVHAATREDPATARLNQSVYSFWCTSVFGQYYNAWKLQLRLLQNRNDSFISFKNDMLWYALLQVSYLSVVFLLFDFPGLLFAISAAVVSILLLETVNYIEHYGLLRRLLPSGRYERVSEIHSWNSNHIMGRIILYELTRHSDHHYKSSKKYQLLNYHDSSPQMPYGYPTSMVLSFLPPLWFRIMNSRIPSSMKSSIAN